MKTDEHDRNEDMDYKEKYIGYYIRVIDRNIYKLYNKKLEKFELTGSQVCILMQLWKDQGSNQKELVKKLEIRPATLSGILDNLVKNDYIIKKQDEKDGRNKRIYTTDKADKIKEGIKSVFKDIERELSKGFTEEEKEWLFKVLQKLNSNLEQK